MLNSLKMDLTPFSLLRGLMSDNALKVQYARSSNLC